jgi:prephenate dehydrogenase
MTRSILILGLGLIGGSLGLALREAGGWEVHGHDADPLRQREALDLGLAHRPWIPGAPPFDAVVLAMPPGAAPEAAASLGPGLGPATLLMDVCSVKSAVIRGVREALGPFPGFLPAHPMAGSHEDGPRAARPDLFRGRRVLLTPLPETSGTALARGRALWESLGATPLELDPEAHDQALALLSHLPHLLAFTLAAQAAGEKADRTLAGPAFGDMTRLARCPPALWTDILLENRQALLRRLQGYRKRLEGLEAALEQGDARALREGLERGRAWGLNDRSAFPG